MTEFRIVAVRLVPWWKQILKGGDNIEVVIEDDRENRKTVTIFDRLPVFTSLLKEYIAKKYCTGNQFWKPPSEKKVKKPKMSRKETSQQVLMDAMEVIGESFDCALIMSEEAST